MTWTGRFRPPLQDAAPNPQPLGPPAADEQLTVGITSHFYVGETSEQALHDFYPCYHRYLSPETNGGAGGMSTGRP